MGIIHSTLTSLRIAITTLRTLSTTYSTVRRRVAVSPSLPHPSPTVSAWQTPPSPLADTQSAALPTHVDILIIGSGITACSLAYHLLTTSATPPRIAILDARAICSGATGRNGGHIKETPYLEWRTLVSRLGAAEARKVVSFRLAHLSTLLAVAECEGLLDAAEARRVQSVDAFFEPAAWADGLARFDEWQREYGPSDDWRAWHADDARTEFQLPLACGAITGPAGALAPYALVTGLYASLLSRFPAALSLDAHTPVTAVTGNTATTPRGAINATHIVHATNAHLSNLLPALRAKVVPARGQMTALRLPTPLPGGAGRSWSFVWGRGFDYLSVRPDGAAMLGGGWARGANQGIDVLGEAGDEREQLFERAYLVGLLPTLFGGDSVTVEAAWSGALGFSVDGLPWVGRVPGTGKECEWVCAGYSGEGMVNAWGCAKALAEMIMGREEAGMPGCMRISKRRMERAGLAMLAEDYM
ncbi:FAD dependent oxidoreductase-domain-containing protein [Geopyxis carbonaria]|nr:FAD dependent oxidoreductase-domain-containing protein [Geopyxis carbonaria]